ncbi:MAG: 30S ribosomal protein S12 methylthiotransferase RimO [Muribaculum sp.]|nr:30S ribosomal protein S12 methylthiotransferase RimO [Muribaculum sp.]
MHKGRIDIISMGCSKNLIDSERLYHRLLAKGYEVYHDSDAPCGEWVVVNTCGFIADAKEESINLILELGEAKNRGVIGKIAVMGCLSQRYIGEIESQIPEVDLWYGKFNWKDFIDALPDQTSENSDKITAASRKPSLESNITKEWERKLTTPPWSAYLKISEGCNRFCAFCAIPIITGRHTSRPIEEILEETRSLVERGVKEFNVIAQDLSSYGIDIYGKPRLADLIDAMAQVKGVEWIRLHYAYPADFPIDVLDVMAKHDNVCKYLDIALQHSADKVLSNMRRHIDYKGTVDLLNEIRRRVPDIKIRTTLMVGFPGEGDEEFSQLIDFVKTMKFERMGAFAYCEEEDTFAAKYLEDNISDEEKQRRLDVLMAVQEDISLKSNESMIGKTVKVLVERIEGERAVGRTQWDSPDVDPEVIINDYNGPVGEFVSVKITGADTYDLHGKQAL